MPSRLFPTGLRSFWLIAGLGRLIGGVLRILAFPLRLFLSVRRSMTAASVTLLLVGIVTLNIVWGYPWTGMFSTCLSMFVVGWLINRIMRPHLRLDFTLPASSPAGQPFQVVTHVNNQGRLPAMEVTVTFAAPSSGQTGFWRCDLWRRNVWRRNFWRRWSHRTGRGKWGEELEPAYQVDQDLTSIKMLRPAALIHRPSSLAYPTRGMRDLPSVVVSSTFPFYLFRSSQSYPSTTPIAITPKPLDGDDDAVARGLLNTLGGWSHRLLSGDALDYTGSREYEVGMPVRRWDFSSWARLGRPIVREFQSPSIRRVILVVDTSAEDPQLERILSLAATAVTDLSRKLVQIQLYVTGESTRGMSTTLSSHTGTDCESLLIRLAAAEYVGGSESNDQIHEVMELAGRAPILVLTARSDLQFSASSKANVTVLRVDQAETAVHRPLSKDVFVSSNSR